MSVTVTLDWQGTAVKAKIAGITAGILNAAAADGVTYTMMITPRDTGFLANTMQVLKHATDKDLAVEWGNITAAYAIWVEIGARGRPGVYMLRRSLQKIGGEIIPKFAGKL